MHLYVVCECFCATLEKSEQSLLRWYDLTSPKCLFSGLLQKVFGAWSFQYRARTEEDSPKLTYSRDDLDKSIPIYFTHVFVSVYECDAVANFWPATDRLLVLSWDIRIKITPAKEAILQNGTSNKTKFLKYSYCDFKHIWANVQVGGERSIWNIFCN